MSNHVVIHVTVTKDAAFNSMLKRTRVATRAATQVCDLFFCLICLQPSRNTTLLHVHKQTLSFHLFIWCLQMLATLKGHVERSSLRMLKAFSCRLDVASEKCKMWKCLKYE